MIKDFEDFVSGINEAHNRNNIDNMEKGECFKVFAPGNEPLNEILEAKKNGIFVFSNGDKNFNIYFYDDIEEMEAVLSDTDDVDKNVIEKITKNIKKLKLGESFMEKIEGDYFVFTKFYEK